MHLDSKLLLSLGSCFLVFLGQVDCQTPSSNATTATTLTPTSPTTQQASFYTPANPLQITIGMLAPNSTPNLRLLMGFGQSVPAINIALQRIRTEHLVDNVNFSFVWYLGDCNQAQAAGKTIQLAQWYGADAVLGPPCTTCTTY